jgi:cytochrome c-type biogenesis protein CcmH/NrfG
MKSVYSPEKIGLIPLDLYPTKEPYKPSYSELMAELEVEKKRVQIEKEKKRKQRAEAKKNQNYASRLISWFWYLFVPIGFYFLLVDPVILILMIGFVIFIAYIKTLALKVAQAPSAPNKWTTWYNQ